MATQLNKEIAARFASRLAFVRSLIRSPVAILLRSRMDAPIFFGLVLLGLGVAAARADERALELVMVPGGAVIMGDPEAAADEPRREATVASFRMMRLDVTNAEFAAFVAATGYLTDPERSGEGYVWADRWRAVKGADWRHPEGPDSSIAGRADHPVVQVSQRDAAAFCGHYKMRLPTEAEWERTARNGDGRRYPWGNAAPEDAGGHRHAKFGTLVCCAIYTSDGYPRTAPVGHFPDGASPYGLLDMAGNVWNWTTTPFPGQPGMVVIKGGGWGNDPWGIRSSLHHPDPPDIGLDMVGIRCAADAK